MTVRIGYPVPDIPLTRMTRQGPGPISKGELFVGRSVALFAVPGAFTPRCSDQHLPSIQENADAISAEGVDLIACLSVNDIFVMRAWGKEHGVGDNILMLADGAAAWTIAAGLDWDLSAAGLGVRSQRYAMVVSNGRVEHLAIEQGGSFQVSGGDAVLRYLRSRQ